MKCIIRWKEIVVKNCHAVIEVTNEELKDKSLGEIADHKRTVGNYEDYDTSEEVYINRYFEIERIK